MSILGYLGVLDISVLFIIYMNINDIFDVNKLINNYNKEMYIFVLYVISLVVSFV